ncbi:unnamed protein product, partial [Allacma fusca]
MQVFSIVALLYIAVAYGDAQLLQLTEEQQELLKFETPKDVRKIYPYYLSGYDEEGSPIWILELGQWDVRKAVETGGDLLENTNKWFQQMSLQIHISAYNSSEGENKQVNVIVDLDGFSIQQIGHAPTVQFILSEMQEMEKKAQNGNLKAAFIINANSLFNKFWASGKSVLGVLVNSTKLYVIHTVNFAASNNLTESEIFAYDVPVQIQDEFLYFLSGYDEDGAP